MPRILEPDRTTILSANIGHLLHQNEVMKFLWIDNDHLRQSQLSQTVIYIVL